MKSIQQINPKSSKNITKKSTSSENSHTSNTLTNCSYDLSIDNLEQLMNGQTNSSFSEEKYDKCEPQIGNENNSILISADPNKILLSKENLYYFLNMQSQKEEPEYQKKKDLLSCFEYFDSSHSIRNQNLGFVDPGFCSQITSTYASSFYEDNFIETNFLNLSIGFSLKKIKTVDKLTFGKNPLEAYKHIFEKKKPNESKAEQMPNILMNFPAFIPKMMPIFIKEENIQNNQQNEIKEETESIRENLETEMPQTNGGDYSKIMTNDTENEIKKEKIISAKTNLKKISSFAKKKFCRIHGEDYRALKETKEGKLKLKALLKKNNSEYKAIRNEVQHKNPIYK